MSLPRNPLLPTNSLERSKEKRQKVDTGNSRKSLRSNYSLTGAWSLRGQHPVGGIISIRGMDPDIPLKSILAQVRGGAIERVTRANGLLFLHFLENSAAELFHRFAISGQFIVQGKVYRPESPNTSMRNRGPDYETALQSGARRVLKISRPVNTSDCRLLYSKMNMLKMEEVFQVMGALVCVQPMFCRNEVAFQIMFEDIESSIKAKKLFELKADMFKQFVGWSLAYSSDPTEQGCYISP